jgi:hypothetical protein
MSSIKKFNFIVEHVSPTETVKILERNFGMPYTYKPQIEWLDGSGFPTKTEEGIFENSYQAVELSEEIFSLLRMVLKDASIDYVERYAQFSLVERNSSSKNCSYRVRIVDLQYPQRDEVGKVTETIIEKDIFDFSFSAEDFIEFNPKFIPHFWKIWKDFSNFHSDEPNKKVGNMNSGIRTLIKDAMTINYRDFTNRFTSVELVSNNYYMA